jgi:small subunit ribosomal protein S1
MDNNSEMDFGKLFENKDLRVSIKTGEKVTGRVFAIDDTSVFVDLGATSDGVMDKLDFADGKGGFDVAEGDIVDAYNMGMVDGCFKLQRRIDNEHQVDAAVENAFASKIPIEGKVTAERKGGYEVEVATSRGFCPFSQIDARGVRKEPADYIGNKYTFLITEYEEGGNLVLSRRKVLEQEAEANKARLRANLEAGDVVDGTVVNIKPFGVFVDLGGVEGMVHISELSWNRGAAPEDIVKVGQRVTVKVLSVEWGEDGERDRLSLSLKQAEGDPWSRVADSPDFAVGTKHHGVVVRLADFGAFVNLAPGIDGLAHISQLGADHRIENPSEVTSVGAEVDVTILGVDLERRRIALCFGDPKVKDEKPAELSVEEEQKVVQMAVAGQVLTGEVESLKPFGVFIKLPGDRTGLLHVSQIRKPDGSPLSVRELYRAYPLHAQVEVVVREVAGDRISLTLPETLEQEQDANRVEAYNVKDSNDASFGNLGDLFSNLKL